MGYPQRCSLWRGETENPHNFFFSQSINQRIFWIQRDFYHVGLCLIRPTTLSSLVLWMTNPGTCAHILVHVRWIHGQWCLVIEWSILRRMLVVYINECQHRELSKLSNMIILFASIFNCMHIHTCTLITPYLFLITDNQHPFGSILPFQMQFFLQVRDSIVSSEIFCPPDTAVLLASLSCQTKYGDYQPETLHPQGFLTDDRLLPERWESGKRARDTDHVIWIFVINHQSINFITY